MRLLELIAELQSISEGGKYDPEVIVSTENGDATVIAAYDSGSDYVYIEVEEVNE